MIVGICGKSGSGKSTLARQIGELTDNDAIHLDIDKIGHMILRFPEVKNELVSLFGESIISENDIDRKKLGEIVFASKSKMKILTSITWKYAQKYIDDCISKNKDKLIILDWISLPETKYFDMCDIKILLDIPYEVRKQRAIKRDNITEEAFDLRENASVNYDLSDFDYVLRDKNKASLKRMVKFNDKSFVSG